MAEFCFHVPKPQTPIDTCSFAFPCQIRPVRYTISQEKKIEVCSLARQVPVQHSGFCAPQFPAPSAVSLCSPALDLELCIQESELLCAPSINTHTESSTSCRISCISCELLFFTGAVTVKLFPDYLVSLGRRGQ